MGMAVRLEPGQDPTAQESINSTHAYMTIDILPDIANNAQAGAGLLSTNHKKKMFLAYWPRQ